MENTPLPPLAVQVTRIDMAGPDETGRVTRGPKEQIRKLTEEAVREAFAAVEYMAGHAAEMLGRLHAQPGQQDLSGMELEFGLAFNAELDVYVVVAQADGSLKVKLTWKSEDEEK
jgi:hypothetical protein